VANCAEGQDEDDAEVFHAQGQRCPLCAGARVPAAVQYVPYCFRNLATRTDSRSEEIVLVGCWAACAVRRPRRKIVIQIGRSARCQLPTHSRYADAYSQRNR